MYITVTKLSVTLRKVGADPQPNQRITFARCLDEALAIEGDLATAALDQANAFPFRRTSPLTPSTFSRIALT
jgi:hypothetical protein